MKTPGGRWPLAPPPAPAYDDSQDCKACHCSGLVSWNSSISTWRTCWSSRSCTQPEISVSPSSDSDARSRSAMSTRPRSRFSAAYSASSTRARRSIAVWSTWALCCSRICCTASSASAAWVSAGWVPRCCRTVPFCVNRASQAASKAASAVTAMVASSRPCAALRGVAFSDWPSSRARPCSSSRKGGSCSSSSGCASPSQSAQCALAGGTASAAVPASSARASSGARAQAASSHCSTAWRRWRPTSAM